MRVGSFIVKRSTICVLRNEWSPAEPRIPIIRWDGYLWIGVMRRNVSSCRDFGTIRRSGPALGRWRLKRILSGKDFTTHSQTERQQSHLWWCMKWVEFLLENQGFQENYVVLEKLIEMRSGRWELRQIILDSLLQAFIVYWLQRSASPPAPKRLSIGGAEHVPHDDDCHDGV